MLHSQDNCQNYIRIIAKTEQGNLIVCGTNSFKPVCREYGIAVSTSRNYCCLCNVLSTQLVSYLFFRFFKNFQAGSYNFIKEKPGQAVCPYDPLHNSTAVYVGECSSSGKGGLWIFSH